MISLHRIEKFMLIISLGSLLWACNNVIAETPPAPVIVKKKIAKNTASKPGKESQPERKPTANIIKSISLSQPEVTVIKESMEKPETPLLAALDEKLVGKPLENKFPPLYDPEGKIDPFVSLIRERTESAAAKNQKKKRVPRTPLEKMDISQVKLSAIIRAHSGNKALVEEASGKGYVITKGTYIGTNSGTVIDILKDRIIVKEETENVLGQTVIKNRELKLQKAPGEF